MSGSDGDHSMLGSSAPAGTSTRATRNWPSSPTKSTHLLSGKVWLRKKKFALPRGKGALAQRGRIAPKNGADQPRAGGSVEAVDDKAVRADFDGV